MFLFGRCRGIIWRVLLHEKWFFWIDLFIFYAFIQALFLVIFRGWVSRVLTDCTSNINHVKPFGVNVCKLLRSGFSSRLEFEETRVIFSQQDAKVIWGDT